MGQLWSINFNLLRKNVVSVHSISLFVFIVYACSFKF